MTNIDEIYDLFTWDSTYTPEEYSRREQQGLELAKGAQYLFPFLQPFLPNGKSKSVWEPCAKVIADRSDEELVPYLSFLFEWLQDLNWPGALCVYERLAQFTDSSSFEHAVSICVKYARAIEDVNWLNTLKALQSQRSSLTR